MKNICLICAGNGYLQCYDCDEDESEAVVETSKQCKSCEGEKIISCGYCSGVGFVD